MAIAACEISRTAKIEVAPFTIPQATYYAEQTIEVPDEVHNDAVSFTSAQVNYSIESSSDFSIGTGSVSISFFVSDREVANDANDAPQSGDERVFTVEIESDDDLGTGSSSSPQLVDILNSGQGSFVVALDVDSSGTFTLEGELTLTLDLILDYTISTP